jgi:hypothetical protein
MWHVLRRGDAITEVVADGQSRPSEGPKGKPERAYRKRVFESIWKHCFPVRRLLKLIASIEHPLIAKLLTHLGLPTRAPLRAPARAFNRLQVA